MDKKVYILLAEGFELIEALSPLDVLRRGHIHVETVSLNDGLEVKSAQKVTVVADRRFNIDELTDGDMIILPGGYPGYVNLKENKDVVSLVKYYLEKNDKYVGAICGAPSLLGENKFILGRKFTCHSSVLDAMDKKMYSHMDVVRDGNLITASGAGHGVEFGMELAKVFLDEKSIENIMKGMELHKEEK
ncbi:4-methyl-5(b-hydroxyethyl)-thiazole monophosphate biosynthesis [Cetobacterium ceti]|uniref:4-methyl-5(B-hydroxyethyl)-thiazole monophosphate biosynthesis n=1 Tax=Cetobacterium ceti TaxID=180163 RepID=A0A1T4MIF9_9FUSO|nr:DJ-1 family glyoxalase III [Cetobacterium ceti]SJZ66651.1 4-methyl-5(b-hydroxyethyl)-thiazole monophosphate biosynthesis [Cetobacterium ceti]